MSIKSDLGGPCLYIHITNLLFSIYAIFSHTEDEKCTELATMCIVSLIYNTMILAVTVMYIHYDYSVSAACQFWTVTVIFCNVVFYFSGLRLFSLDMREERDELFPCKELVPMSWGHLEYMYFYSMFFFILIVIYGIYDFIMSIRMKKNNHSE